MKQIILILTLSTFFLSCGKTALGSLEKKFGAKPAHSEINNFWWSGSGIDHSYLWELTFENENDINSWIIELKDFQEKNENDSYGLDDQRFPDWWKNVSFDELDNYTKVINNHHYFIAIDHENKKLYLKWFDT